MNDATAVVTDHTKKYNIPLSHLEHRYIQHCTDGIELERIYKELIGGEVGSHTILAQLALDRIRKVQPNSQILRQDKLPLDRTVLVNDELRHTDNSSSTLTDHENKIINPISSLKNDKNSTLSTPLINNENQQSIPKSDAEWQKYVQKVSCEFNSDCENDNSDEDEQSKNQSHEKNKRLHLAKQHRLNADTAFKSNNYQQSIDLYTKSLAFDENIITYLNRSIAYFKLDNFDASIQDCFQILSIDSDNVKALYHRAASHCAKQQYEEAKRDLDHLRTIDPDNNEAQVLLNKILTIQKTNSNQTTGDNEKVDSQPSIITSLDIEEERLNNKTTHSMSINILERQNISSNPDSPYIFNGHNIDQFQISSSHDDDEDMALGDEAGVGLAENLSDEEGHISRSIDVSPTMDDDYDAPELIKQKPLQTPPITPLSKQNSLIDQSIGLTIDGDNKQNSLSTISTDDDTNNLYDNYNTPRISNDFSRNKQTTISSNSRTYNNDTYIPSTTINDAISNSNFCSTIQSWLRDLVALQSNRRVSSFLERPWSKSSRPWSLDKIHRDIERLNRFNEYTDAIEVSKKMLQNGILDYHHHAEYIVNTLFNCSECYLKLNNNALAIQYATEALQYNKMDTNTLICRAKAFEKEKFFLFSYADYARVPATDFYYHTAQRACQKLSIELNSTEDETWREKLPHDQNDDERYLTYLKHSSHDSYEWYRTHADQFYLNACFVLAIRCYTYCIELQPSTTYSYLKRAACYLKVFEPQKAIDDCDFVLKEDETNFLALYRKASAYKISHDDRLYELTLKEYIKIQPHNQIVLAEYYTCRHEEIPRKKRRIRMNSIDNNLSYEQLEQIRLEEIVSNKKFDLENSNDIKDQCLFILHSFQSIDLVTKPLIELVVNVSRMMIQAEKYYQQEHKTKILPFSYIKFCFNILIQLTTLPEIDRALSMLDENSRKLLEDLLEYYSSISSIFSDVEKLNRLKNL